MKIISNLRLLFRNRKRSLISGMPAELKFRKLEEIIKKKFKHNIKLQLGYVDEARILDIR